MKKKFFKTTEIKIAVFALVALFLLIWGINFLKGIDVFQSQYKYHVIFERTDGLLPSHMVVVNGMVVGNVDDVQLMPEHDNNVLVTIKVNKDCKIPTNTVVKVGSPGPLSSPQVDLVFGNATTFLQNGDTVFGVGEKGMLDGVGDLIKNLNAVAVSLDTIAASIKGTINDGSLDNSLKNIEQITKNIDVLIAENRSQINEMVGNINNFSGTLKENDQRISNIITNLDDVSQQLSEAKLKGTIDNASAALAKLDTLLENANQGEGTLGQLVANDSLYSSLNNTLNSLGSLLVDLKANPKKYINVTVFGKKEKKQ